MISQTRLDAIVTNYLNDGGNAMGLSGLASKTGIPIDRVRITYFRLTGNDAGHAASETRAKRRQRDRREFGLVVSEVKMPANRFGSSRRTYRRPM